MECQCAHMDLSALRGGGFHYDPMWFHASIFSGVGSPASHSSSPLVGIRTGSTAKKDLMWYWASYVCHYQRPSKLVTGSYSALASYRKWLETASGWQHSDTRGGLVRRGCHSTKFSVHVLGEKTAGKAAIAMWVPLCVMKGCPTERSR